MAETHPQTTGPRSVEELLARLRGQDEEIRTQAWHGAGPLGAAAVDPLIRLLRDADVEVARAAGRALWRIVRHASRPGARSEREAIEGLLVAALDTASEPIGRQALWMLSEIGGEACLEAVAKRLTDAALRDDARCVLQRIPGSRSLRTLKNALRAAPDDFKPAIADSLRARGEKVTGAPSRRRIATKQTTVVEIPRQT
jgi:HEAT repeat protein